MESFVMASAKNSGFNWDEHWYVADTKLAAYSRLCKGMLGSIMAHRKTPS
jgi:hypothetical protein